MKRDLVEMKKKCADRDQLLSRISVLEAKVKKYEDMYLEGDPRTESEEQLLERVKALMVRMCAGASDQGSNWLAAAG